MSENQLLNGYANGITPRFNTDGTPESIQAVKDKTKKELNEKIKIFNQIK